MIRMTNYFIKEDALVRAQNSLPSIGINKDKKTSVVINQPTNNFFYDPWTIKEEFKGTVWEEILETLPSPIGEARVICLPDEKCYSSHCDIDDRYHLNITGQYSYLIDIDSQEMFPTLADCKWYTINAGKRHVAANFGSIERNQLVVRKLLNNADLKEPALVKIFPICDKARFEFDDIVSPWLHKMDKSFFLKDFKIIDKGVSFYLEKAQLVEIDQFSKEKFKIVVE